MTVPVTPGAAAQRTPAPQVAHAIGGTASPAGTPSSWQIGLVTAILLLASRAGHVAFPSLGLVADDRLTAAGRALWPILAALAGVELLRSLRSRVPRPDPWVMATILAVAVSAAWSVDVARSGYQTLVLACVVVSGLFLTAALRGRALVTVTLWVLGLVCALNALLIPFGVGRRSDAASIGLFEHKNLLGAVAGIVVVLGAVRLLGGDHRPSTVALGAMGSVALALSGSRTAQVGAAVAAAAVALTVLWRRSLHLSLGLTSAALAAGVILWRVLGGLGGIVEAGGKDPELTGRRGIWAGVWELVLQRPVLGWGFLSFWREEQVVEGLLSGFQRFGHRSAHSGYLEAALGAGLVGGALVVVTLAVLVVRGGRGSGEISGLALLGTASFTMIVNFAESFFPASAFTLLTLLVVAFSARPRGVP